MLTLLSNDPQEIAEYEQFVEKHPKGHFMQSSQWGRVKEQWEFHALVLRDSTGQICGTIAILIRPLGFLGFKIAYAPRGPVCDMQDEATLLALLSGAAAFVRERGCCQLTLDPDVERDCEALLCAAAQAGYGQPRKNMNFESIQARFVVRLDLMGKTEEDILLGFKPKTRYNLRKAQRDGVRIEVAEKDKLSDFYTLMQATGRRDQFVIRSLDYFQRVMDCMGEHARLFLAYYGDKPVAGAIALQYGDKMWYLYGASDDNSRKCMPTYAVQWAIIQWAMEKGCRLYDLRGVPGKDDPNSPIYGLYRFKSGFGGKKTEFVGELNYQNGVCKNRLLALAMQVRKQLLKMKARR